MFVTGTAKDIICQEGCMLLQKKKYLMTLPVNTWQPHQTHTFFARQDIRTHFFDFLRISTKQVHQLNYFLKKSIKKGRAIYGSAL